MAIKRLSRVGQAFRLPLVCDPVVQAHFDARAQECGNAAHAKVLAMHHAGAPYPVEVMDAAAREADRARDESRASAELACARFTESLDPAALGVDLAGVTHVYIRGMGGAERQDALIAATVANPEMVNVDDPVARILGNWRLSVEWFRRCVLAIDDISLRQVKDADGVMRLPLEVVDDLIEAQVIVREVLARVLTASTLGEAPPSRCDGPPDATTPAVMAGAALSSSATAAQATAPMYQSTSATVPG